MPAGVAPRFAFGAVHSVPLNFPVLLSNIHRLPGWHTILQRVSGTSSPHKKSLQPALRPLSHHLSNQRASLPSLQGLAESERLPNPARSAPAVPLTRPTGRVACALSKMPHSRPRKPPPRRNARASDNAEYTFHGPIAGGTLQLNASLQGIRVNSANFQSRGLMVGKPLSFSSIYFHGNQCVYICIYIYPWYHARLLARKLPNQAQALPRLQERIPILHRPEGARSGVWHLEA